jgi:RNA polymerase sigma factor (sigma-70 family)
MKTGDLTGTFQRAVQGDDQATIQLIEHFRSQLTSDLENIINPRLVGRFNLADVLQELHLQLVRRIHRRTSPELRQSTGSIPNSSKGAYKWVRKLTVRRMIDLYRKHMVAKMRDTRREKSLDCFESSGSENLRSIDRPCTLVLEPPSENLRDFETRCVIQNTINQLSPLHRDVIFLKFYRGLSTAEIAQQLQISQTTVAKRFRRALEKLKESPAIEKLV